MNLLLSIPTPDGVRNKEEEANFDGTGCSGSNSSISGSGSLLAARTQAAIYRLVLRKDPPTTLASLPVWGPAEPPLLPEAAARPPGRVDNPKAPPSPPLPSPVGSVSKSLEGNTDT